MSTAVRVWVMMEMAATDMEIMVLVRMMRSIRIMVLMVMMTTMLMSAATEVGVFMHAAELVQFARR